MSENKTNPKTGRMLPNKRAALHAKLTKTSKQLYELADKLNWKALAFEHEAASLSSGGAPGTGNRLMATANVATSATAGATPSTYDVVLFCVKRAAPNKSIGPASVLSKIPVKGRDIAPCINQRTPLKGRQQWTGAEINAHPTWTVRDLADLTDALKHQPQ